MSADLKYFTQTPILRQIGYRRLAKLLADFDQDLKASNVVLPEPDPQNFDSFADLANALATQRIPHSLHKALLTIENAASPENDKPLWSSISRRIPGVSVSQDCALDRALDLWILAPDELSQFAPVLHSFSEGGTAEVQPRMHTDEHGLTKQTNGVTPTPSAQSAAASPLPSDGRGIKGIGANLIIVPRDNA